VTQTHAHPYLALTQTLIHPLSHWLTIVLLPFLYSSECSSHSYWSIARLSPLDESDSIATSLCIYTYHEYSGEASFDLSILLALQLLEHLLSSPLLSTLNVIPIHWVPLLRLGCCLRPIVTTWVSLTPHQASRWQYQAICETCERQGFLYLIHIYMSFYVTTSLFSMHSMFPIHAIAIWLPNNTKERGFISAPETKPIYSTLWRSMEMLGHSMEVYIDVTLI